MAKIKSLPEHRLYESMDDNWLSMQPIVGTNVDGKATFMVGSYLGRLNHSPIEVGEDHDMVAMRVGKKRYTLKGYHQNQTFSINIPGPAQANELQYLGHVSGYKVPNKAEVARLKVFYGKLGTAPMVEQCPVNYECSVVHSLDLGSHLLIVGQLEQGYISDEYLTDGKPDWNKIRPLYRVHVDKHHRLDTGYIYYAFDILPNDPKLIEVSAKIPFSRGSLGGFDGKQP